MRSGTTMNKDLTSPTISKNRIVELDIFRGFAILGIFMVNILVMNVSLVYRLDWEAEQTEWIQGASLFVLETFFYSKFFTIFSFLFGLGVALQVQQLKNRACYNINFFLRRFGSLFGFGVLHILFIWSGDILHLYAVLGLILLFMFRFSAKTILWSAAIFFFFPFFGVLYEQLMEFLSIDYKHYLSEFSRDEITELKRNGSYLSGMQIRLKEFSFASGFLYPGIAPMSISMMLLGGYIVKKEYLFQIESFTRTIKKPLLRFLFVIVIYRFTLLYWILPSFNITHGTYPSIALATFYQLSDITLAMFFLWTIARIIHLQFFMKILIPLKYVGRSALSNYILQSIFGYFIMRTFNGYDTFSAFECFVLVFSLFTLQVFISKIWLSYFQFGPLEWCWRCISYMNFLPIRKSNSQH